MNGSKNIQTATLIRFSVYFTSFAVILFVILKMLSRYGLDLVLEENGIIEWLEFLWLILSSLFLFLAARRTNEYPVLYPILSLLPLIAGIRELDGPLDKIFHGAWMVPATILELTVLYRIIRSFGQFKAEALRFTQTQRMVFLGIGLFIVVVFAQLSGQQVVWLAILGEHYVRSVGRFVEELLEFLGYIILLIGTIECYISSGIHRAGCGAFDTSREVMTAEESQASRPENRL
jgi:hypothetical protein